ncbi:MAG: ABC transporter permease [Deinococcales bacterium]
MRLFVPFVWLGVLLLCLVPNLLPVFIGGLLGVAPPDFGTTPLALLLLVHLALVLTTEAVVLLLGVPLAIWVTRPERSAWRQLLESLAGLGQTVPTLAILALAVPVLGLGLAPTLFGMVLYGLMPVVSNGITGFLGLDKSVLEAATGMGMTARQRLYRIELPLALPVLMAGIRTSTVYNVATAVVGATLGAGGLGLPIINGLSQQNTALVLVGAVLSALLALTLDAFLALVSR